MSHIESDEVAQAGRVEAAPVVDAEGGYVIDVEEVRLDEGVLGGGMSVDDDAFAQPVAVDVVVEIADPEHLVKIFKGVVDLKIEAGMNEDVFVDFEVVTELFHPIDVRSGDVFVFIDVEAFEGIGFTVVPVVGFVDFVDEHLFVVAPEAEDGVARFLELPYVVDDAFGVGATVDVVAQEIELVLSSVLDFE